MLRQSQDVAPRLVISPGHLSPDFFFSPTGRTASVNLLPEPDDVREDAIGTVPLWKCPNRDRLKAIEQFGWRFRRDIYPGKDVWHKQSWYRACRGRGHRPHNLAIPFCHMGLIVDTRQRQVVCLGKDTP
jgi:hypothetical protein